MADLPTVRPEKPAEPVAAGTRPALSVLDVLSFLCELFAFASLAIWGVLAWPFPWNIGVAIAAPLVAILLWGLFVSPRAVFPVHPFIRAFIELLVYASATLAWWSGGQVWIGVGFAVVAVTVGVLAGRRRFT